MTAAGPFAPWQRAPRPPPRTWCCVCLRRVRVRDTWPIWDGEERVCKDCMSIDDARLHRHEFAPEEPE